MQTIPVRRHLPLDIKRPQSYCQKCENSKNKLESCQIICNISTLIIRINTFVIGLNVIFYHISLIRDSYINTGQKKWDCPTLQQVLIKHHLSDCLGYGKTGTVTILPSRPTYWIGIGNNQFSQNAFVSTKEFKEHLYISKSKSELDLNFKIYYDSAAC